MGLNRVLICTAPPKLGVDGRHRAYFVDLFVRMGNHVAIGMYERFGYSVYRRVVGYYHSGAMGSVKDDEDAYGTPPI